MEKLTLESFKRIGKRFSAKTKLFKSFNTSYTTAMTHGKRFAIFIQSVISLTSEDQLKNFLNKELIKLTKDDLKETFEWNKVNYQDLINALKYLLDDKSLNLTNLEIQFIVLMSWKLYNCSFTHNFAIMEFLNVYNMYDKHEKKRIAMALIDIDYLDYFDTKDHAIKKELFELSIKD